jgi:hypothetical protein
MRGIQVRHSGVAVPITGAKEKAARKRLFREFFWLYG